MVSSNPCAHTQNRKVVEQSDQMLQASAQPVEPQKGLPPNRAFSLASIGVDFQVAEAVDLTQLVSGKIPKSLFLDD